MTTPSPEAAAAELAAAVTVTIEVDDGSTSSTMVYGVCPHLIEWAPGVENLAQDCFEILSNYLTGKPRYPT
jgi:hypothetical protein